MGAPPLDPDCLRYVQHWEPVLSGPSRRMLERLDATPAVVLDLGAGTGHASLALKRRYRSSLVIASRRWSSMISSG